MKPNDKPCPKCGKYLDPDDEILLCPVCLTPNPYIGQEDKIEKLKSLGLIKDSDKPLYGCVERN